MKSIAWIKSERQEYLVKFNFLTGIRHIYRISENDLVEIIPLRRYFDPLKLFLFLQDVKNPARTVDDRMLDCLWNKKGNIEIEITDGLLAMLYKADPDEIIFAIKGKEKTQGEPIYFRDIGFIVVNYLEKERTEKEVKDEELSIENPEERNPYALPAGYSTHGGRGSKTKTAKVDKKEKPKLRIVPKREDRKKKAAKYPKPPKEVWEWCKSHYGLGEWRRILRGLHKFCIYRKRKEDKYYPGKSEKKNRQYVYGQVWLANKMGVDRKTIVKWFKRFETDGIIYIPYRGYKERGASVCELAYKDSHRRMNKRKTGERKNPLSIR